MYMHTQKKDNDEEYDEGGGRGGEKHFQQFLKVNNSYEN
jgi:hypothetical protein